MAGAARAAALGQFSTPLLLEDDEHLSRVVGAAIGVPADAVARRSTPRRRPRPTSATAPRRATPRTPPAILQGKTAQTDGPERFTAPSIVFRYEAEVLVAGGWQPLEAYDLCVANLLPDIERRPTPTPEQLLPASRAG